MPNQNGPGSNDNEGVLHIPQSSEIGATSSDAVQCPNPRHWLRSTNHAKFVEEFVIPTEKRFFLNLGKKKKEMDDYKLAKHEFVIMSQTQKILALH